MGGRTLIMAVEARPRLKATYRIEAGHE